MIFGKTITTNIPGTSPIKLKAWYQEFSDYYPDCEPETKKWFVENVQHDWHIIDCGANIGYYSILFSRLAPEGTIYAIEPTVTVEMLKKNLNFNKCHNVNVHKLAVGSKSGQYEDAIYRIWGNEPERQEYDFITMDDFVIKERIERLDCIKIDVDSFDFEVLQGAEKTMERFDPYIIVELNHALSNRKQSNMEALEWMQERGYSETLCLEHENFVFRKSKTNKAKNPIKIFFKE